MEELGRVLQGRREQLGMDLDQLQTQTKIRKRYLIALEKGDWSILPGDVYARGFVRSYAECVGLNGRDLLEKYVENRPNQPGILSEPARTEEPIGAQSAPKATTVVKERPKTVHGTNSSKPQTQRVGASKRQKSHRGSNAVGQAAAVVAVLAVLGGAWWMFGNHSSKPGTPVLNETPVGNAGAGVNDATGNVAASGSSNGINPTNGTGTSQPAPPQVQVVAAPFKNNEQTYTVTTAQPIVVVLSAKSDSCWVKVTADGAVVDSSDTLAQGQTKTWKANQSMVLRVGNVPGVVMTINGQAMTLPTTSSAIDVQVVKSQT